MHMALQMSQLRQHFAADLANEFSFVRLCGLVIVCVVFLGFVPFQKIFEGEGFIARFTTKYTALEVMGPD